MDETPIVPLFPPDGAHVRVVPAPAPEEVYPVHMLFSVRATSPENAEAKLQAVLKASFRARGKVAWERDPDYRALLLLAEARCERLAAALRRIVDVNRGDGPDDCPDCQWDFGPYCLPCQAHDPTRLARQALKEPIEGKPIDGPEPTGDYKRARAVIPLTGNAPRAEDVIRQLRNGEPIDG